MTQVKICGLKRAEDARFAAEVGADLLGFIFAPSRRQVHPATVRSIVNEVQSYPARTVGVFVNADPAEMNRVARWCRLDLVQLSGDEPDEIVTALDVPAIQVLHVGESTDVEALAERITTSPAALLLLDTAQAGSYGGTGHPFDWSRLPKLDRSVLLAGGLSPQNVRTAIGTVRPWGVDVSSGVESDGEKDHQKIQEFIAQVRSPA